MTTLKKASFKSFSTSTEEDWEVIRSYSQKVREELPGQVIDLLKLLQHREDGNPLTGYDHSLQSATRAYNDNADDETVFIALMHDIGQVASLDYHSDVSAAIIRPFVTDKSYWIVKHHEIFQGYYFWHYLGRDRDAREAYRGHPYFDATAQFCELYDENAFDVSYPTKPIEFFEPLVRQVFAHKAWSLSADIPEGLKSKV